MSRRDARVFATREQFDLLQHRERVRRFMATHPTLCPAQAVRIRRAHGFADTYFSDGLCRSVGRHTIQTP
ncbi:hypothetical protein [Kingella potus]|uniref:hypothetical protein n=1 Tax=Kingella potus TaxID=265175 RepID=UPI001FD3FA32|nr:hypothetical protein [Kingella potus]UOP01147.1 hypothetical protein LVJ84_02160 [Kingella potus]